MDNRALNPGREETLQGGRLPLTGWEGASHGVGTADGPKIKKNGEVGP